MADSHLVKPKINDQKTKLTKNKPDCRSDVTGYYVGPTSVLSDMSSQSDVTGKDCCEDLHII